MSSIIALVYISQSELWTVNPMYTEEWVRNNPQQLEPVLYGLGLDVNKPYETQFSLILIVIGLEISLRVRGGWVTQGLMMNGYFRVTQVKKQWTKSKVIA